MKTNSLRKTVISRLRTVSQKVYFEQAPDDAGFPHVVVSFGSIVNDDFNRSDIIISMDVWDRDSEAYNIEELCDSIEALFNNANVPNAQILPTFFLVNRLSLTDEDKGLKHRVIKVVAENYKI